MWSSGTSCPVAATSGTSGLSISIRFGMSPALASCRIFVIRFAYGIAVRFTVMFGCAFMNCALYQFKAALPPLEV
jgi:hypothetical protein